jgi:hypothetical protein
MVGLKFRRHLLVGMIDIGPRARMFPLRAALRHGTALGPRRPAAPTITTRRRAAAQANASSEEQRASSRAALIQKNRNDACTLVSDKDD